jgi:hypothetical protein
VYAHINPIKNEPFYIGKGTGERAYKTDGRNEFWHRTVSKYGYGVVKLIDGLTEEQSLEIEKQYIKKYGLRKDGGVLVNLTYGGSGGRTIFEHNAELHRKNSSLAKMGRNNPNYGKRTWLSGKKVPDEIRKKISAARIGYKMPEDVKKKVLAGLEKAKAAYQAKALKVQCLTTEKIWANRRECVKDLGITITTFKNRINSNRPIKGNHLRYVKK